MAYRIDNAIIKKDRDGKISLIDPENVLVMKMLSLQLKVMI